ncbi:MAG: tripartite tricarboxylate transporter substrate binding protein [Thermodesulfobacteriota bacterium]
MTRMLRIAVIGLFLSSMFGFVGGGSQAVAQEDYPNKPITFIIPYEAGSGADLLTRPLLERASKILGVPIMVVNKPGASGTIGLKQVLDSKPDGYTLGQHSALASNKMQGIFPKNQKDVDMIGVYQYDPATIVCNAGKPWRSMKDVIEYAKSHPEDVKVATSAKGAIWWLATVTTAHVTKVKFNILPQAGAGGLAATQAAGGHTDLAVAGLPEFKTLIDAGNLRLLAVCGPNRIAGKYNAAPTMKELGWDVNVSATRCILGPKGMPKPVLAKLQKAFGEAAQSKEYKEFLANQNSVSLWQPGAEGVKNWDEQEKTFRPILEQAGLLKEAK